MKTRSMIQPVLTLSFAAACGDVQAQAFDAVRLFGVPAGNGEGSVGAVVISGHQYMGSDERRIRVLPGLDYRWSNGWFAGTGNGIGYVFAPASNTPVGLRLTVDLGRSESRSAVLSGLGDIDARPEIGAFFNYLPNRNVFLTSSLRYGAGNDRKGAQLDLGAGYGLSLAPQWRAAAGVAVTLVNRELMQSYFGISAAQSAASGYPLYEVGAGLRDMRASAALNWSFAPAWTATAALSVSALQGDAKNSPIVRERTSTNGVLALSYRF